LLYFKVNYLIANIFGFIVSVYNAFFWSHKYVFGEGSSTKAKTLLKTYVSYGGTFLLSTILMYILVTMLGISDKIAPLITLIVTVPLNFLINKFWTFK
jgi:putative flippase GtrA